MNKVKDFAKESEIHMNLKGAKVLVVSDIGEAERICEKLIS